MINKNDLRKAISSIAISNAKRNTIYKAFSDLPSISKEEFDSVKSDISKVVETMLTKDTVGKANGVASLDSNGSVPVEQLGNITENLQQIGEKTHQLEDSIKNIAVTGGASTADAVTFDNAASGMAAVNAQGAIEELNVKKLAKTDIVQESGNSEELVMSQKGVTELVKKTSTFAIANRVKSGGTLSFLQSIDSYIDRTGRILYYPKARISKDLIKIGSNVELKYDGLLQLEAAIVEYDINLNIVKFWNVANSPEFAIDGKITSLTFKTSEKTTYIDFCTLTSMTISFVGDGSLDYYIVNRNDFLRETPSLCKFTNSKLGSFAYEGLNTDGYSHIILYGQSLSTGDNSYVPVTGVLTPMQEGCYMVGQDPTDIEGSLNQLKAAVPNNSSYQHSNGGESPICNAVYAFKACLNHTPYKWVKLIGSACGYGGKTIEQLSDVDGIYYNRFKSVVNTAKSNAGNEKINCPAIIWMQGEFNQSLDSATTVLDYKEKLVSLKNNMQAYVMQIYGQKNKPLFYVYQPSYLFTPKEPIVAQALLELSLEHKDIIMVGPHYFCPVSDGGHLTPNGYRWYGEYIAKALYQTLIYGQRLTPILPKEIKIDNVKKRVVIDFLLPNPPFKLNEILTPSVQDYGFAFYKNNVKQEISNIIIRENQVIIYVPFYGIATYEIEYAGQATNGMGNISDSDEYTSFGKFVDPLSIYTENASSDDHYNRIKMKDADLMYKYRGKSLVNQNYPCFNWIPTFRKKLYI